MLRSKTEYPGGDAKKILFLGHYIPIGRAPEEQEEEMPGLTEVRLYTCIIVESKISLFDVEYHSLIYICIDLKYWKISKMQLC